MYPSERFLSKIRKYRKTNRTDPPDRQIELISAAFMDCNRNIPANLAAEIFEHFSPQPDDDPSRAPFDSCQRLADVTDVLQGQYDEENDPIGSQDWSVLSEIVSDNALDLDMDFVTYVMTLAVDHGAV